MAGAHFVELVPAGEDDPARRITLVGPVRGEAAGRVISARVRTLRRRGRPHPLVRGVSLAELPRCSTARRFTSAATAAPHIAATTRSDRRPLRPDAADPSAPWRSVRGHESVDAGRSLPAVRPAHLRAGDFRCLTSILRCSVRGGTAALARSGRASRVGWLGLGGTS